MRFLSFLLSVATIVLIFTGCGKDKENVKTYKNEKLGFTIEYPKDWLYREGFAKDLDGEHGSIVVFQAPSEGKKDIFRENVNIFSEAVDDSITDVSKYLKYSKNVLTQQLEDVKFFEEGKRKINGESSSWIYFEYVSRFQQLQSIGFIFLRDGYGLVITSTARPEDFMKYRRTFEDIATSIEFN